MPVSISLYNHTAARFASGANAVADNYRLALFSAATFDATDVNFADVAGTQLPTANGYTQPGVLLTGVTANVVSGNDAAFDANNAVWTAAGGNIAAAFGVLYNDSDAGDPLVAFIDFDGTQTAGEGTDFIVAWNANGIVQFTVA
jgi:hypothetical protein